MQKQVRACLLLTLASMIWGLAFVIQSSAADVMPPFAFNASRYGVACLVLALFSELRGAKNWLLLRRDPDRAIDRSQSALSLGAQRRKLWLGGVCCGILMFLAGGFQQMGLSETAAGKAGFVTSLYIVLVPLASLLLGRRVGRWLWLAVALCIGGLYLLCFSDSPTLSWGDRQLLLCALCFTAHILVIDRFSRQADCVQMSGIQFLVAAILSAVMSLCYEHPTWDGARQALPYILYVGAISGGVGFTLQMIAQRDSPPTAAALIMSLESVFALLAGWIFLHDQLSTRELIGCAVMLLGVVVAQCPLPRSVRGQSARTHV